ncbi:hypothetical protein [Nonomuraea dietziae]|uniref:hypothetical protein n=1 Tax=Nonomuraea dietziae TaxID=65515 RepID=UPI00340BF8B6
MKIITAVVVMALQLGGCAHTTSMTYAGWECTAEEKDLIPVLAAQKILAAHPAGAVARNGYTGCFPDDPYPYAGKFYEFTGARKEYTSFYKTALRADGWRLIVPEEPSEEACHTKKIGDATAFLTVGGHSVDGVGGYDIRIAASYGEVSEGGGLLC